MRPPLTKALDFIPVEAVLADRSGVRPAQVDNRVSVGALEEDSGRTLISKTFLEHSLEVGEEIGNHPFRRKSWSDRTSRYRQTFRSWTQPKE